MVTIPRTSRSPLGTQGVKTRSKIHVVTCPITQELSNYQCLPDIGSGAAFTFTHILTEALVYSRYSLPTGAFYSSHSLGLTVFLFRVMLLHVHDHMTAAATPGLTAPSVHAILNLTSYATQKLLNSWTHVGLLTHVSQILVFSIVPLSRVYCQ